MIQYKNIHINLKPIILVGMFLFGTFSYNKTNAQSYCTPSSNIYGKCCGASSPIGLDTVTFGNSISNSTSYSTNKNYYNFTNISACVNAGSVYYMQVNSAGSAYQHAICVWIDWNADNAFDTTEIVLSDTMISAGGNISDSIYIPSNQNTGNYRMRVLGDYYYYYAFQGAKFNPCQCYYGEYQDYTIKVSANTGIDVFTLSISNPSSKSIPLNTNFDIDIIAGNLAATTIDSVEVGYTIDNGSATTKTITGLALTACSNSSAVNITNTAKVTSSGSHILKVWVNKPNGINPDDNPNNDTITSYVCTSLSGNLTIDPSTSASNTNFIDFTSAVDKLNKCGINGAVKFTIASGTYSEQIVIGAVNGASSTNTITFDGVDASTRILTTANSGVTFKYDGASHIIVKNLTIENTASNNAIGVQLTNVSEYNSFDSCIIRATSNNYPNVAFGGMDATYSNTGDFANYTTVDHSEISGGYLSVVFVGDNNKNNYNNKFKNTYIHGAANYGAYFIYQDSVLFQNCHITSNNGYPMMAEDINYSNFFNNNIHGGDYSFYAYYLKECNIINNQVYNSRNGCVYGINNTKVNFFHNSLYNDYTNNPYGLQISSGSGWDVRNNIFSLGGNSGYAFYVNSTSCVKSCDYNVYNTGSSANFVYIGAAYTNLGALTNNPNGMNNTIYDNTPAFYSTSAPVDLHITSVNASPTGDGSVGISKDIDNDTRCGFAPTIGCDESKYNGGSPKASFTMPDTGYINSPVLCLNGAGPKDPKAHQWFTDCAVNASPLANTLNFTTQWSATGTYHIKLVTQSCSGYDTLCKAIVIINPIKAPTTDFLANVTTIEEGDTIDFTDLSTDGPSAWNWSISWTVSGGQGAQVQFVKSTTNTNQNTSVVFNYPGYYTICLTASNSKGSTQLCKKQYIEVLKVELMCNTTLSHATHAKFYDDGGKNGNYNSGSQHCYMLIDPCASQVTIDFQSFNVNGTYNANLKIYDGKDATTGKPFHSGNGFTTNPGTLVAKSGMIYIDWTPTLYSWSVSSGWEAEWTSVAKNVAKPSANFTTKDTFYESSPGSFFADKPDPDAFYFWDINNSGTNSGNGKSYITGFVFTTAGTYSVCCYATNCGGTDTFCKNIIVVTPKKVPAVDFKTDISGNTSGCQTSSTNSVTVIINDTVSLLDNSNYGPTSWKWSISNSSNITWVGSSTNTDQNPKVIFGSTGYYDIKLIATNGIGTDSLIKTSYINVISPYCVPSVSSLSSSIAISNVKIATINNASSTGGSAYTNYSAAISTCLTKGGRYPFSISRNSNVNAVNINFWIDLNMDGDFTDTGELVATRSANNYYDNIDTIKIPDTTQIGHTRIRIGMAYNTQSNTSCGTNYFGEFEDYGLYIISNDIYPPVIKLIGDSAIIEQCDTFTDSGAVAWDDIDGYVNISTSGSINTGTLGKQYITYSAQDKAGNKAIQVVRQVNVVQSKKGPIISLIGPNPAYVNVNSNYTDSGITAVSNCGNGNSISYTSNNNVNTSVIGSYKVNYKATYTNGNFSTASRTVIVGDYIAPIVTLNPDSAGNTDTIYVNVYSIFTDPNATATDNYTPLVSLLRKITGSVNTAFLGSYIITYSFTDSWGNVGSKSRTVIVVDKTAPVITLVSGSQINIEADKTATYTDPGYTVSDNYWLPSKVNTVITGGPVDRTQVGSTFRLTYTATDPSGNIGTNTRDVKIVKTSKPAISLLGNTIEHILKGSNWNDPGVLYNDSFYSNAILSSGLTQTGSVDTSVMGVYQIKYKVCDPIPNCSDEISRFVVVDFESIVSPDKNSFIIYPNPTNGIIKISILSANVFNLVKVYGVSGYLVKEIRTTISNGYEIDLSDLPAGMYQLNLVGPSTSNVKPIIITK